MHQLCTLGTACFSMSGVWRLCVPPADIISDLLHRWWSLPPQLWPQWGCCHIHSHVCTPGPRSVFLKGPERGDRWDEERKSYKTRGNESKNDPRQQSCLTAQNWVLTRRPQTAGWKSVCLCLPCRTPGSCFGSEWSVDRQPTAICLHRTADRCTTLQ